MSSTPKQNVKDRAKSTPRSKNLPWFQANIGSSLTPEGRQLLEEYSGIPPEEVVAHIYNTVSLLLFPSLFYTSLSPLFRSTTVPSRFLRTKIIQGKNPPRTKTEILT